MKSATTLIVNKDAKIRNRYNLVPHLTKDTTWKMTKTHNKVLHS